MLSRIAGFAAVLAVLCVARDAPAPIRLDEPSVKLATLEIDAVHAGRDGEGIVEIHLRALSADGAPVPELETLGLRVLQDEHPIPTANLTLQTMSDGYYVLQFAVALDGKSHELRVEASDVTVTHSILYPRRETPRLRWIAARAAALRSFLFPSGVTPRSRWIAAGAAAFGSLLFVILTRRVRKPGRLRIMSGSRAGDTAQLRRGRTRIGAFGENDVVLPSDLVSRFHAEIRARGRRAIIRDLGSTIGTFLNGGPIEAARLSPGDKIRIADVELFYDR